MRKKVNSIMSIVFLTVFGIIVSQPVETSRIATSYLDDDDTTDWNIDEDTTNQVGNIVANKNGNDVKIVSTIGIRG